MFSATTPRRYLTAALHHVDAVAPRPRAQTTAGSQRKVTHLALDAAWHGAAPAGAHALRAQFIEHELARQMVAWVVLRGGWPPHGGVYGG